MQSPTVLAQLRTALDCDLNRPKIEGYTDAELEQLRSEIRALDRYNKRIEAVLCRRELAAFDRDLDLLSNSDPA